MADMTPQEELEKVPFPSDSIDGACPFASTHYMIKAVLAADCKNCIKVEPFINPSLAGKQVSFKLTYAEGKDSSNVSASAGTIVGDVLTVTEVAANATITISDVSEEDNTSDSEPASGSEPASEGGTESNP